MTMGPEPMSRILRRSVRFGIGTPGGVSAGEAVRGMIGTGGRGWNPVRGRGGRRGRLRIGFRLDFGSPPGPVALAERGSTNTSAGAGCRVHPGPQGAGVKGADRAAQLAAQR